MNNQRLHQKWWIMAILMVIKMHLWRWRLTTKKAFSQNALNEIFWCQRHAVGSLWNHMSSICQDWLEHWIQSFSCNKTFSRISSASAPWSNKVLKNLWAPILQTGVISGWWQGKEDWLGNYSAVNPKHLIEHWAHTYGRHIKKEYLMKKKW